MSDPRTILVIDDDPQVRATLERVLEREGYAVVMADDGERGLDAFRAHRPDLVITDLVMPNKEGIETICHLRELAPTAPVIAISGGGRKGSTDYLRAAQRLGASAVLAKPFSPKELVAVVARCLAAA